MLKSTKNKGFSLTFENGITISVQFGSSNYCERKNLHANYGSEMLNDIIESLNEVARWIYIASTSNNIDEIHHSNLPE
jgi:hypothetical protein